MSTNVEMVALDDDDSDENTFQRNETANSSTAAKTIPVAIVERTKANPADVDVEMQKKPQATAAVAMSVEVDDSENFTGDFLDRVGHQETRSGENRLKGKFRARAAKKLVIDRTPALNFVVELFGTALLCLVIYLVRGTVNERGAPAAGLTGVALAHGWALAALAGMFGKLSGGHFNPAVTLMMVLTKQMPGLTGGFYVVAQVFGASAASAFCVYILPPFAQQHYPGTGLSSPIACGVFPKTSAQAWGTCWMKAFGAEFLGTLLLLMTILMTAVAGHSKAAHVSIGFSLAVGVTAFGPVSNACLNPARAFGSAMTAIGLNWDTQWVWIVAPLLASFVASYLYMFVFRMDVNSVVEEHKGHWVKSDAERSQWAQQQENLEELPKSSRETQ